MEIYFGSWVLFLLKSQNVWNVDCVLGNELHSDIRNTQSCPSFELAFKIYFYANMFLEKGYSLEAKGTLKTENAVCASFLGQTTSVSFYGSSIFNFILD